MDILRGKVVRGKSRGKDLGFPTANIAVHKKIEEGIYLAKVRVDSTWHSSLTFIGKAVTFNEKKLQAESYLLGFSGNLYGKYITITLLKKIRENKKFASVEELTKQMQEDLVIARKFFTPWC
jgi:riboflavin kinase/FMN adenylyltransferase